MSNPEEIIGKPIRRINWPVQATLRAASAIWTETKSDAPLYIFIGVYALTIGIISMLVGDTAKFQPLLYVWAWLSYSYYALALILTPLILIAVSLSIWRNPAAPFSELLSIVRPVFGPRVIAGTLMITITGVFYGTFTSAKNMLPDMVHNHWDVQLAKADRLIHGGVDPSAYLMGIGGVELTALNFLYGAVWHVLVLGLAAFVALSKSHERVRHQFLLAYFMCWIIAGNIEAALFYSGGPCFYDLFTGDGARFLGLTKSITTALTLSEQSYLRAFFKSGEVGVGAGIAAFPSMHVTAATIIALLLGSIERRLGWLGLVFVALIEVGSVRLGWHYAIDGYTGICTAVLVWCAAGYIISGYSHIFKFELARAAHVTHAQQSA